MVDLGFNIWPSVKVIADRSHISLFFSPSVSIISITDEIELSADKLEITFPAGKFAIPRKGAEIEVFLGYWPLEISMGKFVVDTRGGDFINYVKIWASVSPHSDNTAGRLFMQEQKSRHFDEGTTLGDLISYLRAMTALRLFVHLHWPRSHYPIWFKRTKAICISLPESRRAMGLAPSLPMASWFE